MSLSVVVRKKWVTLRSIKLYTRSASCVLKRRGKLNELFTICAESVQHLCVNWIVFVLNTFWILFHRQSFDSGQFGFAFCSDAYQLFATTKKHVGRISNARHRQKMNQFCMEFFLFGICCHWFTEITQLNFYTKTQNFAKFLQDNRQWNTMIQFIMPRHTCYMCSIPC